MSLAHRPERAGVSEIVAAALITLLQIPLAYVFTVILMLLSIRVDACEELTCNIPAADASVLMPIVVGAVVLALTIALIIVWAIRGGALWRAPVLGLVLIIVDFAVALIINNTSLTPSS